MSATNPINRDADLSVSLGGRTILDGVNVAIRPGESVTLSDATAPVNRPC